MAEFYSLKLFKRNGGRFDLIVSKRTRENFYSLDNFVDHFFRRLSVLRPVKILFLIN